MTTQKRGTQQRSTPRRGLGQRDELVILLPAALLILVILVTFTLFAYRNTLDLLLEERQREAERLARQLSAQIASSQPLPDSDQLQRLVPLAVGVTIVDEHGAPKMSTRAPEVVSRGIVSGSAPFKSGERNLAVRVDLPATVLHSREQSVRVLSWVVLSVGVGVSLIVLFFLPRWLAPIDRMLERARGVRQAGSRDDVDFLVETFENALELLVRPGGTDSPETPEKSLARTLTQLGELAAGVAHELRNSLATLRGYLTLIERDPQGGSLEESLGEIRRESDHLQRVLEDFLAFARPGSARLDDVDLLRLLHRAAADPAIVGVRFRIDAEPALATEAIVHGDAQLLERALRNLLHNAARAHSSESRVEPIDVELISRPQEIEVTISDRGPGLPAQSRERLFDPFVTEHPGGVGLGLSVARRIVVLHGGRVTLEDRPGGGARAVVALPRGKVVTKSSGKGDGPSLNLSGGKSATDCNIDT